MSSPSSSPATSNASSSVSVPYNLLELLDATIWMNLLRLLIALNTIGSNGFLLCLFARFKHLRNSQCNRLILLNAVMDFFTGFGPLVRGIFQLYIMSVHVERYTKLLCLLISFPYTCGYAGSQISFIGLALDRLFAVIRPLHHKGRKQKKFVIGIGILALVFMVLLYSAKMYGIDMSKPSTQCSIPLNSGPYFSTFWTLFIGISTLIVFVTYLATIFYFFQNNSTPSIAANISDYQAHVRSKEKQLTITIALILLNYTISWTVPSAIWFAFNFLDPSNTTRLNYMSYVQGYMGAFGCGLNLYIYLYKHLEIQHCTKMLLSRFKVQPMWTYNIQSIPQIASSH